MDTRYTVRIVNNLYRVVAADGRLMSEGFWVRERAEKRAARMNGAAAFETYCATIRKSDNARNARRHLLPNLIDVTR